MLRFDRSAPVVVVALCSMLAFGATAQGPVAAAAVRAAIRHCRPRPDRNERIGRKPAWSHNCQRGGAAQPAFTLPRHRGRTRADQFGGLDRRHAGAFDSRHTRGWCAGYGAGGAAPARRCRGGGAVTDPGSAPAGARSSLQGNPCPRRQQRRDAARHAGFRRGKGISHSLRSVRRQDFLPRVPLRQRGSPPTRSSARKTCRPIPAWSARTAASATCTPIRTGSRWYSATTAAFSTPCGSRRSAQPVGGASTSSATPRELGTEQLDGEGGDHQHDRHRDEHRFNTVAWSGSTGSPE